MKRCYIIVASLAVYLYLYQTRVKQHAENIVEKTTTKSPHTSKTITLLLTGLSSTPSGQVKILKKLYRALRASSLSEENIHNAFIINEFKDCEAKTTAPLFPSNYAKKTPRVINHI